MKLDQLPANDKWLWDLCYVLLCSNAKHNAHLNWLDYHYKWPMGLQTRAAWLNSTSSRTRMPIHFDCECEYQSQFEFNFNGNANCTGSEGICPTDHHRHLWPLLRESTGHITGSRCIFSPWAFSWFIKESEHPPLEIHLESINLFVDVSRVTGARCWLIAGQVGSFNWDSAFKSDWYKSNRALDEIRPGNEFILRALTSISPQCHRRPHAMQTNNKSKNNNDAQSIHQETWSRKAKFMRAFIYCSLARSPINNLRFSLSLCLVQSLCLSS